MERLYRYRCIFDMKFSAIPYGAWTYCNYDEYLEILQYIKEGKKYHAQNFLLTHNHGDPKNEV